MIAPLRRRHRWMTASLALTVPVLYGLALAARPAEPVTEALPAALAADPRAGEVSADFGNLFTDPEIGVRARGDGQHWWLELEPAVPISRPETLVYWAPSAPGSIDSVPDDAFLLGPLSGVRPRTFALPAGALGRVGSLVLFSLGHQEVFATAEVPAVGTPPAEPDPSETLLSEESSS